MVGEQTKVGTITVPLDKTSISILKTAQAELRLENQSQTLQRILSDWWWGKSSSFGHNSWPE